MSRSLVEQIEEHFDQVEDQQPPITAEEVDVMMGSVAATQSIRRLNRRGPLMAAATAATVLLAGAASLLVGGDGSPSAYTTPQPTIAPATPSTVATPTTRATQAPETTLADEPQDSSERSMFGFPPGEPILDKTGFDITDTLIYVDQYIEAIEKGTPEPLLDTSSLGIEEVLVPIEAGDSEGLGTPSPDVERSTEQLVLWAVVLEGTDIASQFGAWLEYATDSEAVEFGFEFVNIEFGGMGGGSDHLRPPESAGLLSISDGGRNSATHISGLPPDAAVVSTTYGDGTTVWQRPLFGMAVFNNTTRECQPEPFEGQGCTPMEIVVFDAHGAVLFRILTPISESEHGYRITMPNGDEYLSP